MLLYIMGPLHGAPVVGLEQQLQPGQFDGLLHLGHKVSGNIDIAVITVGTIITASLTASSTWRYRLSDNIAVVLLTVSLLSMQARVRMMDLVASTPNMKPCRACNSGWSGWRSGQQ